MPYVRILIIVLATLAVAGVAGADDTRTCHQCGEPISGGHFETGGRVYHPDHFRCTHCDKRIEGTYTEYKARNYHNDCFRENVALRCDLCDGVIQGEYVIDDWGNAFPSLR